MNYKTTISGIAFVGTMCGTIAGATGMFPFLTPYAPYLLFASFVCGAIVSYFSKDKDVTGGNRPSA